VWPKVLLMALQTAMLTALPLALQRGLPMASMTA